MSKNAVSENLISHTFEPQQGKRTSMRPLYVSRKTGKTLNDFYTEIQAKKISHGVQNVYHGKNAGEIEIIMMQNRKLIEANHSKLR